MKSNPLLRIFLVLILLCANLPMTVFAQDATDPERARLQEKCEQWAHIVETSEMLVENTKKSNQTSGVLNGLLVLQTLGAAAKLAGDAMLLKDLGVKAIGEAPLALKKLSDLLNTASDIQSILEDGINLKSPNQMTSLVKDANELASDFQRGSQQITDFMNESAFNGTTTLGQVADVLGVLEDAKAFCDSIAAFGEHWTAVSGMYEDVKDAEEKLQKAQQEYANAQAALREYDQQHGIATEEEGTLLLFGGVTYNEGIPITFQLDDQMRERLNTDAETITVMSGDEEYQRILHVGTEVMAAEEEKAVTTLRAAIEAEVNSGDYVYSGSILDNFSDDFEDGQTPPSDSSSGSAVSEAIEAYLESLDCGPFTFPEGGSITGPDIVQQGTSPTILERLKETMATVTSEIGKVIVTTVKKYLTWENVEKLAGQGIDYLLQKNPTLKTVFSWMGLKNGFQIIEFGKGLYGLGKNLWQNFTSGGGWQGAWNILKNSDLLKNVLKNVINNTINFLIKNFITPYINKACKWLGEMLSKLINKLFGWAGAKVDAQMISNALAKAINSGISKAGAAAGDGIYNWIIDDHPQIQKAANNAKINEEGSKKKSGELRK